MGEPLGRLIAKRKRGDEPFYNNGADVGLTLSDFWGWSASDLVSNATRGRLAEFIVAGALGIPTCGVRDEWQPYDLVTPNGLKIEVKSAAYVQSWHQRKLSKILFGVPKTRAWDAETNTQSPEPQRQADIYVFALLAHLDKKTIDPLNFEQWRFYVLPAAALNARTRSQHSITLRSLEGATQALRYEDLKDAVHSAG